MAYAKIKSHELIGQRFGQFTVVAGGLRLRNDDACECICDCGNRRIIAKTFLISGMRKSCGCKRGQPGGDATRTHGLTGSPEYSSWRSMKERCYLKNSTSYMRYGAIGITVCSRWRNDFAAFYSDLGPRPVGTSLDRYPDCRGNYAPGNCRWATRTQQANNRRSNHVLVWRNISKTITEWADLLECGRDKFYRMGQRGMTVEDMAIRIGAELL